MGRVVDPQRAVIAHAKVILSSFSTGAERTTETDDNGNYQIAAVGVGQYRLEIRANGFRRIVIERLDLEVGRVSLQEFQLEVGNITEVVTVASQNSLVERATISVGQVINEQTAQELPLNGRHFIDLGLLIAGSVTPPQNGNLSPPARGQGSFALNTAGNREDTVNFQINGVNLNDQINNILTFSPPLSSIQEFKVDNSTFSAEYGRNSGAIVNIATRPTVLIDSGVRLVIRSTFLRACDQISGADTTQSISTLKANVNALRLRA
jgi:hypothetical protein